MTFPGVPRAATRGFGTRNYIVLIGATSMAAGLMKAAESRCKQLELLGPAPLPPAAGATARAKAAAAQTDAVRPFPNVDGVVAVTHTEGGGPRDGPKPHNHEQTLRTLAAFMVHPNVGAGT
jgi:altronate dehydratase